MGRGGWWLVVAVVALVAAVAEARPGGGQGYSGDSSSSGSGSSSSGGDLELVFLLIRLIIEYPAIGVPVALIVAYFWFKHGRKLADSKQDVFVSAGEAPVEVRRSGLAAVREHDPEFSAVLFEDFMYALYARVQAARVSATAMAGLAPYVAEGARAAMLARAPAGVAIDGVVIGAMRVVDRPEVTGGKVRVGLEFEANFTAQVRGRPEGYYVHERWVVERAASARSKPPTDLHTFNCPSCGAPWAASGDEQCRHCGRQVGQGKYDWTVMHVQLLGQDTRPPALTSEVAEQGTGAPTVWDPRTRALHEMLISEDPGAAPQLIEQRFRKIYEALNRGWSALDLRGVRPFVSDSLYSYLEYWILAYRREGLRNVLEGMKVSRVEFVKLTRDKYYDAITLRFWASGKDYTIRTADGTRVSGSKSRERAYSEYWTLIRGAKVRGAPRAAEACPNCGAPLDRVSMAGSCEYCGAHMTRGEFDWVLSKIEQDEAYSG